MGDLTRKTPKTLLSVGTQTILDRMISSLVDEGIKSFVCVVGDKQEVIRAHIQRKYAGLSFDFVVNERFAETNTGYSLFLAREAVAGESFVKIDGDLVFEPKILKQLLLVKTGNGIAIDTSVSLHDEEVKVISHQGALRRIGKELPVVGASGESIGMEIIAQPYVPKLFAELETIHLLEKKYQSYYELAYDRMMQRGSPFQAVDITGLKWNEIDTMHDLERARGMFSP